MLIFLLMLAGWRLNREKNRSHELSAKIEALPPMPSTPEGKKFYVTGGNRRIDRRSLKKTKMTPVVRREYTNFYRSRVAAQGFEES